LKIFTTTILIAFLLLTGCTQEETNKKNVSEEIELIYHKLEKNPVNGDIEVIGSIKKIGNATIDHDIVGVYFYNKKNELIYYGNYSIYSFVKGYNYDWFVIFRSTHPRYNEYDHYSIELDYV